MNSNWNPTVGYLQSETTPCAMSPNLPDDLSTIDVDAFLDRIYALATQI